LDFLSLVGRKKGEAPPWKEHSPFGLLAFGIAVMVSRRTESLNADFPSARNYGLLSHQVLVAGFFLGRQFQSARPVYYTAIMPFIE